MFRLLMTTKIRPEYSDLKLTVPYTVLLLCPAYLPARFFTLLVTSYRLRFPSYRFTSGCAPPSGHKKSPYTSRLHRGLCNIMTYFISSIVLQITVFNHPTATFLEIINIFLSLSGRLQGNSSSVHSYVYTSLILFPASSVISI